jgi:hypothetical protein
LIIPTAVAVVLLAAAAGVVLYLDGRDITVHGTVQLIQGQFTEIDSGCEGAGGYSDIQQGAQVTVSGPDGKLLAFAKLPAGHAPYSSMSAYECDFNFTLTVPSGKGIYIFAIPRRGSLQLSEARLNNSPTVRLGIGSVDGGQLIQWGVS